MTLTERLVSGLARSLYSALVWAGQPLLRRKLRRRAQAEPGYAVAVEERFGRYTQPARDPARDPAPLVWVHAVSLGETRAAAILVAALRQARPDLRVLWTHGTATGRAEGAKHLQPGDVQVWQPWDTPGAVARFLRHFRPQLGVLMETEIWPNLVAGCRAHGVPLALANARLSDKSLRQAQRLTWLARPAYAGLTAAWAQTEADAQRLRSLGARVDGVFGNLKFDAQPEPRLLAQGQAWRAQVGRPVVLLASSREGEEALWWVAWGPVLKQKQALDQQNPAVVAIKSGVNADAQSPVQWLIVPRHPQRFDAVAVELAQAGLTVSRRSQWGLQPKPADVWLGDSLGEMALYYGLADIALLGGSFAPLGGQNLIEAAACGCPVVLGPHTFNFAEAAEQACAAGAAVRVADMAEAIAQVQAWMADAPALARARRAAENFAQAHRGAAAAMAQAALPYLG